MSGDDEPAVGTEIDGFRLDAFLHRGGMADLWRTSRVGPAPDGEPPLVLKRPRVRAGVEPSGIVGSEV